MKVKNFSCYFSLFLVVLVLASILSAFPRAFAQAPQGVLNVLNVAGDTAGYYTAEENVSGMLDTTIGLIISIILGFLSVIFLIIIIFSGFQWMTAGGNEETVTKARKRMINATIGLIIVIAGYVIAYFVISQLADITMPSTPQSGP